MNKRPNLNIGIPYTSKSFTKKLETYCKGTGIKWDEVVFAKLFINGEFHAKIDLVQQENGLLKSAGIVSLEDVLKAKPKSFLNRISFGLLG